MLGTVLCPNLNTIMQAYAPHKHTSINLLFGARCVCLKRNFGQVYGAPMQIRE